MKYIIKRVLIGVSIGVLLMIIKGNFLFVVNAKSINNSNNIIYSVPNNEDLKNYDNVVYSNFFNDYDYLSTNKYGYEQLPHFLGTFQYKDLSTNEILGVRSFGQEGNDTFKGAWFNMFGRQTLTALNIDYANAYNTLGNFSLLWSNTNQYLVEFDTNPNNTYEILIEIEKEDGLNFYQGDSIYEEILDTFELNLYHGSSYTEYFNAKNYMTLEQIDYITPDDLTNGNKNLAYLKLRFSFSPILNNANDLHLYSIIFDSDTIVGSNRDLDTPFLFNTNDNDKGFTIKSLSFIKNGVIDLRGGNNNDTSNINYTDLDSVSQNDLKLFDLYENCDSLDIACHTRNILTAIKQFIVRIGNFIKSIIDFFTHLFIPTSSQMEDLKNYFTLNLSDLNDKLGFLSYPFQVISDIFTIYINVLTHNTSNYVITIPALREPIWNNIIYSGGTLDLGYIINYGVIKDLYDIYYMFISVYIILLFLDLCYDSFSAFISGNLHTSSSYTQQDLEMFNYNTGEVHTTTRTIKTSHRSIRS